jgi:hypothetical protein
MSVDQSLSNRNAQAHSRPRGRPFEKGNGGRKQGSKNKTTLVAEALLKGEEVELMRKAIELAKAGDGPMLKFLLERILPKERSVRLDLPAIEHAHDSFNDLEAIIDGVCTGQIAPSEAATVANLIMTRARILNETELKLRLDDIEERQKVLQHALESLVKEK